MEFKVGDLVQLKSGGPEMTVHNIVGETTNQQETTGLKLAGHSNGELICKWFQKEELKQEIFKPETVDNTTDM